MNTQPTLAVRDILGILFLRKWTIMLTFFGVVCAAAFLVFYLISPTYQASASIIINAQDVILPVVEGIPASDFEKLATFHTQKDIMRSAQIASQVVDELGLDKTRVVGRIERIKLALKAYKRQIGHWLSIEKWKRPEDFRALSIDAVMKGLELEGKPESQAIKLTYNAKSPHEAADTLNAIINAYKTYYYDLLKKRANGITTYLESQLSDVDRQLALTEQKLLDFKRKDRVNLRRAVGRSQVDEKPKPALERIASTGTAPLAPQARQLEGDTQSASIVGITDSPLVQNEMKLYVLAMEDELRKLLAEYTEKDPRIVELREKIQTYTQTLKEIPDSELTLLRLKRTYEINHETALHLRKTLEKAKAVVAGDTRAINVISVIDSADVDDNPVSPKPRLAMLVALVFGLAFALVIALIRHYLDHALRGPQDIERYLGLKPLGSLPSFD